MAMTVAYLLVTLTSIGFLSEGNPWASYFEFSRCAAFLYLTSGEADYFLQGALRFYFIPSMAIWAIFFVYRAAQRYKLELKYSQIVDEPSARNGVGNGVKKAE